MKIMVVDDIGHVRYSVSRALQRHGYTVIMASSGNEAIRVLKCDATIELVITDLNMPEMGGIELFQQVQIMERMNDDGIAPPPAFVLMTTIHLDTKSRDDAAAQIQHALDIGFADALLKPVSVDKLIQIIQNLESETPHADEKLEKTIESLRNGIDVIVADNAHEAMTNLQVELQNQLRGLDDKLSKLDSAPQNAAANK